MAGYFYIGGEKMDLLIEKDDKRTYLSRYKVITTSFEESSPSVKRNNTQIQYRNGSVDFGGWNEAKTIDYVGYYRADDLEDEEYLRERIYALLSDPDGYYITQLKNDNDDSFERPGETSGDYFDKQVNRPSHKRFYVYASSLESELVGSYGGHVLYKISATFTTMKLPYGESVPRDLEIKPMTGDSAVGTNLLTGTSGTLQTYSFNSWASGNLSSNKIRLISGQTYTARMWIQGYDVPTDLVMRTFSESGSQLAYATGNIIGANSSGYSTVTWTADSNWTNDVRATLSFKSQQSDTHSGQYSELKLEKGSVATDWCPNPSDPGYSVWYLDTYYNTDNLVIPYAGTVPCNQLEQGFAIEFTAKASGSNLKISLNGTDFVAPGNVVSGDVFKMSGYEYLRNGVSIVKATNKAYFKLLPGIANKISSSIAGSIRILNYQDLYA